MFRATLLSIVLSMAVGPNVSLLCRTWCDARAAAASGCHHEHSSTAPNVAGSENCDRGTSAVTAALREDVRRGTVPSGWEHAIPVSRYQLAQLMIDAGPGQEPGREWRLARRPLATALRI